MQHDLAGASTIRGIQIRLVAAMGLALVLAVLASVAPRDAAAGSGAAFLDEDTDPPTVWWSPSDSILARDTANVTVGTFDDVAVVRVDYTVDGAPAGSSTVGPSFSLDIPLAGYAAGSHQLFATGYDAAGNHGSPAFYRGLVIDRTAPILLSPLTSASHTAGAFSTDPTIEVAFGNVNDDHALSGYDYGWSTSPTAAESPTWVGSGLGMTLVSDPVPDGRWYFHLRLVDWVGNVRALRAGPFKIDRAAPTATTTALAATQSTTSFVVRWTGSDPGGKVDSFDVRYRKAAPGGAFGAPIRWKSSVTAVSATFTGLRGYRYCFSSRAIDKAGNVSAWSAETCTKVAALAG